MIRALTELSPPYFRILLDHPSKCRHFPGQSLKLGPVSEAVPPIVTEILITPGPSSIYGAGARSTAYTLTKLIVLALSSIA
jgi:hypothetical protein